MIYLLPFGSSSPSSGGLIVLVAATRSERIDRLLTPTIERTLTHFAELGQRPSGPDGEEAHEEACRRHEEKLREQEAKERVQAEGNVDPFV